MARAAWWATWVASCGFAVCTAAFADDADNVAAETETVPESDASGYPSATMFEFLVAELAAQRGDIEGSLAIYNRLAREMRDPLVARRAVETAIRARLFGPALDSATLLLELDSESTLAREIIAALLANEGDLGRARERVAGILAKSPNRGAVLMQLSHLFAKFQNKQEVLEATQAVALPYDATPEAHYAVGIAALIANRLELALAEADEALARKPAWDYGAILKAQVLRKSAPDKLIAFYRDFVAKHPDSVEVRMQLGRELAAERKVAEAREEFREAEKRLKNDGQAAYAIGLLSLQLEDFTEAQVAFTRALKFGYREPAAIYLGLGQAAEGLKRVDEAIGWYKRVDSGDWVRAQLKIATLLARQQGVGAGRDYLRKIEPRSSEDQIQIIQVEAQLLREAKAWRETYEMLEGAVRDFPDAFELRYDLAMAAERVDRIDVLETQLRRVMEMRPDYAHAYNALGYTLAEKTDRLDEAKTLIEKAVALSPEDPFILDSLGWVHYRLGRLPEALKYLQQAYSSRADPEIAAHLGEVLWKVGQRDEAAKIWRAALDDNPGHESLIAVIQKYKP
jgi:tetratricopeptide (TPR) repeat protein